MTTTSIGGKKLIRMNNNESRIVATNVNEFEPSLWNFIGQYKAIFALRVAVDQFFNDRIESRSPRYPLILLTGDPGCGKRTLAYSLSQAFGNLYLHEAALVLGLSQDPNDFFDSPSDHTTYYIPNFTQVSPCVAGSLINIVRDKVYYINIPFQKTRSIQFDNQLMILSAVSNTKISQEVLKHVDIYCTLTNYSPEQIYCILKQRTVGLGWQASGTALRLIADKSKNNPGVAIKMLQQCYRIMRSEDKNKMLITHAQKALVI